MLGVQLKATVAGAEKEGGHEVKEEERAGVEGVRGHCKVLGFALGEWETLGV